MASTALRRVSRTAIKPSRRRPRWCLGKEVLLQTHGRDRSGRILAEVRLPDGTHVNHTLVKNGWCWWYLEIRSQEYRISEAREACTRGEARLMGESDSCPAVGVAEENPLSLPPALTHAVHHPAAPERPGGA